MAIPFSKYFATDLTVMLFWDRINAVPLQGLCTFNRQSLREEVIDHLALLATAPKLVFDVVPDDKHFPISLEEKPCL